MLSGRISSLSRRPSRDAVSYLSAIPASELAGDYRWVPPGPRTVARDRRVYPKLARNSTFFVAIVSFTAGNFGGGQSPV